MTDKRELSRGDVAVYMSCIQTAGYPNLADELHVLWADQRDHIAEVEAENGDLRKRLATANDLLDPVSDVLNRKIDQLVVLEAENERLRKAVALLTRQGEE